jgi:MFS family permease
MFSMLMYRTSMFWMMTVSRGIIGFGVGGMFIHFCFQFPATDSPKGEYPASSTSASEAANEHALKNRGPIFILVTNLPLSFGTPLAVIVFLIVFSACHQSHFSTVWVCVPLLCRWQCKRYIMSLTFHAACLLWHRLHFTPLRFLLSIEDA